MDGCCSVLLPDKWIQLPVQPRRAQTVGNPISVGSKHGVAAAHPNFPPQTSRQGLINFHAGFGQTVASKSGDGWRAPDALLRQWGFTFILARDALAASSGGSCDRLIHRERRSRLSDPSPPRRVWALWRMLAGKNLFASFHTCINAAFPCGASLLDSLSGNKLIIRIRGEKKQTNNKKPNRCDFN